MEALVEFDYTADEADELTIRKGDIVKEVSHFEEGWFIGNLNGTVGVFPDNFVKIVSRKPGPEDGNSKPPPPPPDSSLVNPKPAMGIGLGNIFNGQPIHLSQAGLREVKKDNASAITPVTNNNNNTSATTTTTNNNSSSSNKDSLDCDGRERVRARYSYEPQQRDEIKLNLDDIVLVLDKKLPDEGWWRGMNLSTKQTGLFPDNFVEPISSPQETALARHDENANNLHPVGNNHDESGKDKPQNRMWRSGRAQVAPNSNTGAEPPKTAAKPQMVNGTAKTVSINSNAYNSNNNGNPSILNSRSPTNQRSGPGAPAVVLGAGVTSLQRQSSMNSAESPSASAVPRVISLTTDRPKPPGKRHPTKISNATHPAPEFSRYEDHIGDFGSALASTAPAVIDRTGSRQPATTNSNPNLNATTGGSMHQQLMPKEVASSHDGILSGHAKNNSSLSSSDPGMQSLFNFIKDQNAQLRQEMQRMQKTLTDRVQSLMLEVDEMKKARAGDAVELARLKQLVMQIDAQKSKHNSRK